MSNVRRRLLVLFLILFGVGIAVYSSALQALFTAVLHREGSSHGVFVPFISGYLLWVKFDKIKELKPQTNLFPGIVMLLVGMIFLFLAKSSDYFLPFSVLSFLFVAGAMILVIFGKDLFKEVAFPLFFLATMSPIPPDIYAQIAYWMRVTNTWGSVLVTESLGVPLYREEFNIYLPAINLFVADGCSGIRYLLSYFTFSLVYAFLFKQSISGRLFVVLGSIPLSIVSGIARLSVIFLSAHYINPVMAQPRPHIILSWIVFAVFFVGVVAVDQYISGRKKHKAQDKS